MKTMKFTKRFFSLLFISSLLLACSKDDGQDGATGPIGPQGEQGVTGADGGDGEQGGQGEQGDTGTANVIYSDWIASEFGSIPAAEQSEQLLVTLGLNDFNTTRDVIVVYGRHENNVLSDDILQLPFELFSQNEVYRFRLTSGNGFIALYADTAASDGGNKLFTYFNDYRYIIIPGGNSTSGKSANIDYTKMSYEKVVAHFGIKD